MNAYQSLWWQQAKSDLSVLILLRRQGAAPCHQLHYLQMVTEKLAKAYFWRSGTPPPKSHAGFVQFMRRLGSVPTQSRLLIAKVFGFRRFADFQHWISGVLPLAYSLEILAPANAFDGPNPEYPWPHDKPGATPVTHNFTVWKEITGTARGRELIRIVEVAVNAFAQYA
jgi:hypothetical protein